VSKQVRICFLIATICWLIQDIFWIFLCQLRTTFQKVR
jgi:hypothetical protein